MLSYIYIPTDVVKRCRRQNGASKQPWLVGFSMEQYYVAVDVLFEYSAVHLKKVDPQLRVIGRINLELPSEQATPLTAPKHLINFRIHEQSQYLHVDHRLHRDDEFSIIFFSPPNLRNLEYFTVKPIFLQSTGKDNQDRSIIDKIDQCHQTTSMNVELPINSDAIMDLINRCQKLRDLLGSKEKKTLTELQRKKLFPARLLKHQTHAWYSICVTAVTNVMFMLTGLIQVLNSDLYGLVPVKRSAWCKQLDLRLRQATYFPIQFMCYYDTGIVSEDIRKKLDLPPANKRLNINNSNYINLYNSVWLIFNDVLLGRACYHILVANRAFVFNVVNNIVLKAVLFAKLERLIEWVGLYHPAGFKLNNDLGSFMQSMFIWTSQSWTVCFDRFVIFLETDSWLCTVLAYWLRITCSCGISFVIAGCIDYLKFFNLHIYFFNIATTKIYNRQVEMLKSLMQLFRGKKYNILRKRVDTIEESQFRIDQLLLGTFCFMFLLYLLPTTFAFYILFFLARLTILTVLKLGEKAILCFNLYPLFVVLLKLKNSKRLQGGVYFESRTHVNTNWFIMKNKALSFSEIYGNFYKVFRQEGQCVRLFMNLLEGKETQLRDTTLMKKNYLMLPRNYRSLPRIWVLINSEADDDQ